ncbi:hypothetical protein TRAPUB_3864 [Trametes pubescens]|uniref:Uncharacterized protein n=1 Tax=Trametes pubescens TaxID=154538 RepID=A0A1M2VCN4_TRAPU|nr:hypothetical protein TRAPUB_3864 [Trametes pubescens]
MTSNAAVYEVRHEQESAFEGKIGSRSIAGIAPSEIVVSSPMESSRLPIELCEAVMSALREYYDFSYRYWFLAPRLDWPT